MAIEKIHIEQFLRLGQHYPVLDVRSPGEFNHAHIPGAYSLPLFSDEERKVVGTTYKQQSREAAIKIGLDFFGPKMRAMVDEVERLVDSGQMTVDSSATQGKKIVLVHCWRGGMRSAGVAWLLDLYGFKVYTLVGGYKFFRRWALQQFELPWTLNILGGYTGSGKTEILKQLADHGENVIDLECIANHKGSAFGNIGLPTQPSQEMFENKLALQFFLVDNHQDSGKNGNEEKLPASEPQTASIWMEDESQRIGSVNIPQTLWLRMRNSKIFFLDIPFAERLGHIAEEYGNLDKERMIAAIERIQKRLGGLESKMSIQFLEEGKIIDGFRILLKYYDKWYLKGLNSRNNVNEHCDTVTLRHVNAEENAIQLLQSFQNFNGTTTQKKLIDEPGYR